MKKLDLKRAPVKNLEVVLTAGDLRKDLHTFTRYVAEHDIKRTHRDNLLPRQHLKRLARLMTHSSAKEAVEVSGHSEWIDYLDRLSLTLKFVDYETEGVYAGYSSVEPSYPDNYMTLDTKRYERFLSLPLQTQEDRILAALSDDKSHRNNEFFVPGPMGRLDRFDTRGSATGVMPTLPFPAIRRHLLSLLAQCESGIWFSTASFVESLKVDEPFFLISKELPKKIAKYERTRYHNFRESKPGEWGKRIQVGDNDKNAFERVEGRYIERFIEGIPLAMGYVDVAYAKKKYSGLSPSLGVLRAFRLTDRFLRALQKRIPEPKVTVLPNLEVHVDSSFYPAATISKLSRLGELLTEDVHTLFKLKREKVARVAATDSNADVIALLKGLSVKALPANVQRELASWVGHSESFVLYSGFGLLEGKTEHATTDRFLVERISPSIAVVSSPQDLYDEMERAEQVPIKIRHGNSTLHSAPEGATTLFGKKSRAAVPGKKKPVFLKRKLFVTLEFPNGKLFEAFSKALLDAKCVVPMDRRRFAITYSKEHEEVVKGILRDFKTKYNVRVKDAG